jgi:hypothetical protein
VKQFVRFRLSSSVQPVLLIIDTDHDLVDHNLIRSFAAGEL